MLHFNTFPPILDTMDGPDKGKILIAEPFLGDPNFERSVVLITDHGGEGTVGYVLNRPLALTVDSIIPDFPVFDATIYNGGPVEQSNLYFLHNRPDLFTEALLVAEGLYWGGDFNRLKEVIELGLLSESEIRFYLGYSGWGRGQLEAELAEKSWRVLPLEDIDIFTADPEKLWKEILSNLGGDYQLWANAPSDPLLN